jgi:hypothetical protein
MPKFIKTLSGFQFNLELRNLLDSEVKDGKTRYYSKEVCDLYSQYQGLGDKVFEDFYFMTKVIACAIRLLRNRDNQYLGITPDSAMRERCIIDTYQYIHMFRPRSLSLDNWIKVLTPRDAEAHIGEEYFISESTSITSAIHNDVVLWVQRPQGQQDLLMTLFLFFGRFIEKSDGSGFGHSLNDKPLHDF